MATWTPQVKNASTWTNQQKSIVQQTATAGLYYGFGCFTYSGGQNIGTTTPTVWAYQNKS
jgi:hypothetical protein